MGVMLLYGIPFLRHLVVDEEGSNQTTCTGFVFLQCFEAADWVIRRALKILSKTNGGRN